MHLFYVVGDGVLDRLLNEKERERVIGNYVIRRVERVERVPYLCTHMYDTFFFKFSNINKQQPTKT